MTISRATFAALVAAASLAIDSASRAQPEALTIEVSGCSAFTRGPTCELPLDRTLHVWAQTNEDEQLTLLADHRALAIAAKPIDGGRATQVEIPPGARRLTVRARGPRGERSRALRLALPRIDPAISAADALRKKGQSDEAWAVLAIPSASDDRETRTAAESLRARIALSWDDTEVGLAMLTEAARESREAGRWSEDFVARTALAYTLIVRERRFVEARDELALLHDLDPRDAKGRAGTLYYEGLLANETGDVRTALKLLREAGRVAARSEVADFHLAALQIEVDVLQVLGREREAEGKLREAEHALKPDAPPCERAGLLNNVGWFVLQARRPRSTSDAKPALESALRLYGEGEGHCLKVGGATNVLTNLALAAFEDGDVKGAVAWLDKARATGREQPDARIAVWWSELEGRIALALGKLDDAISAYDRLAAIADAGLLPTARWRAALGRARALDALGRIGDAGAAYDDASVKLTDQSLLIPLGEGRESFLRRFDEVARHHVAFLMKRDPGRAADVARRSRARTIAALRWADRVAALAPDARRRWDEALAAYRSAREAIASEARKDWTLTAADLQSKLAARREREAAIASAFERALALLGDRASIGEAGALRGPEPGEIILVYYPIFEGANAPKLAAFALFEGALDARVIDQPDPKADRAALADALFSPFAERIARAAKIRVIAAGELESVDIHALPFQGAPLIARGAKRRASARRRLGPPRCSKGRPPRSARCARRSKPRALRCSITRGTANTAVSMGGRAGCTWPKERRSASVTSSPCWRCPSSWCSRGARPRRWRRAAWGSGSGRPS